MKYEPFSEMVIWLRRIAMDPCNKKSSSESQCRRVLKVRKVFILNSSELPWKKRKHHQLLKESPTVAADSLQQPKEQCIARSMTASVSCLINCTDSADSCEHIILKKCRLNGEMIQGDNNLSRKRVLHENSFQADAMDWNWPSTKEHPMLICSDDSCSGSNPQVLQTSEPVDISSNYQADLADRSPTSKQSSLSDSDESAISSKQSSPVNPKEHLKHRRLPRLTKFIGDSTSPTPIPIGPRFQADIPDWIGSTDDCSSDNSRWLGTPVWPHEAREFVSNSVLIGKGRPCSCSCDELGSTKCIKHHLVKKRLQLRIDLGAAYFIWRFNEMGEEVSRSWTQHEQNTFDILVKTNPVSKNKSFLKPAIDYFTSKCRESIVSYYFNVSVLRRMSRRTRLDPGNADSDDDEADGSAGYSKSVRTRYLITHR